MMLVKHLDQRCRFVYSFCTKIGFKHNEELRDIAKTSSKIITFIKYPDERKQWNIQKNALRSQIIKLILTESETQYSKQKLLPYFENGVSYNKFVFNQTRVQDGTNKSSNNDNSKIIFSPTNLVTNQVFQLATSLRENRQLLYGLFGTSKTFSFMLYCRLSSIIAQSKILGAWEGYQDQFRKYQVPKMIYLNINPIKFLTWASIPKSLFDKTQSKKLIDQFEKKSREYCDLIILEQCPQLQKMKENFENQSAFNLIQHISKYYSSNNLKTVLLIDQINKVASEIRKFQFEKQKFQSQFAKASYYACEYLNSQRLKYMNRGVFDKIIMNSSYNIQLYNQTIKNKLQLFPQQTAMDQPFIKRFEYFQFFKEKQKEQKATWEIIDMLMFQVQNRVENIYYQSNEIAKEAVRRKLYQLLKDRSKKRLFTPLNIRQGVTKYISKNNNNLNVKKEQKYLQVLKNIINNIIVSIQQKYKQTLRAFLNKGVTRQDRIKRKKLVFDIYQLAVQKCLLNQGDNFITFNFSNKLTQIEKYDRNLFIPSDNSKLESLITAQSLIRILYQEPQFFDQQMYDYMLEADKDNGSSMGWHYEQMFLDNINQSIKATLKLSNEKQQLETFNFSTVLYIKSLQKKKNKQKIKDYNFQIQVYFQQMLLQASNLMEQNEENIVLLIPSKKQDCFIKVKEVEDKEFFSTRNFQSKFFDFSIMKKKKTAKNQNVFQIHLFDLTITQNFGQKIKNVDSFAQQTLQQVINEIKQKFEVKLFYWILNPHKNQNLMNKFSKMKKGFIQKAAAVCDFSLVGSHNSGKLFFFDKMNIKYYKGKIDKSTSKQNQCD